MCIMETDSFDAPRRSRRSVKVRRSYSPDIVHRKTNKTVSSRSKESFSCDRCKTTFAIPLQRRKVESQRQNLYLQQCREPETNRLLTLCNACGLAAKHKPRRTKARPPPLPDEKEKYIRDARLFAHSLVETLKDPDAERLYCPEFKLRPCACLQRYVVGGGDWSELTKRAQSLLYLLKEAKSLSREKYYKIDEVILLNKNRKGKRLRHIGLGNGQKRSRAFEEFVLMQRKHLREELGICERATQKVLMYSNNFLHKKLKTEPEKDRRIERKKGKAALGLLKPIEELVMETCCEENCVLMANTHAVLLKCWRDRATLGQAETRRVLAEMLTPSAGRQQNCYKFISLVTGCSNSTISRVSEQMQRTGGDREPPEHGLKRFWQEQAKKQPEKSKCNQDTACHLDDPLSHQNHKETSGSSFLESLTETETGRHSTCLLPSVSVDEMPCSRERFTQSLQQAPISSTQQEKDNFFPQHFPLASSATVSISEQDIESSEGSHVFEISVEQSAGLESSTLTRLGPVCPTEGSISAPSVQNRSPTDYANMNLMQQPLHQIFVNGESMTLQVLNSGLGHLLLLHSIQKDGTVVTDKCASAIPKESMSADANARQCTEAVNLNLQKHTVSLSSDLLSLHTSSNTTVLPVSEHRTCPLSSISGAPPLPEGLKSSLLLK